MLRKNARPLYKEAFQGEAAAVQGVGAAHCHPSHSQPCPQKPGTLLRIFIPAGAVINVLNLIELSSPSGICLLVRVPLFGGQIGDRGGDQIQSLIQKVRSAGGSVEVVQE